MGIKILLDGAPFAITMHGYFRVSKNEIYGYESRN